MANQQKAVIIGSGIGGLGTAALLAKAGWQVTVLEKNSTLGGRANIFTDAGFTFDMGPSWYLMPDVFEHYFELLGERISDHLDLHRLSPSYRVFFKDDTAGTVDIFSDLERDIPTLEKLEPGSGEQLKKYLDLAKRNYDVAKANFMYKNYDSIFDFLTPKMAIEGSKLSVFTPMHRYVSRFFKTNAVKKIMEYTLVFLGSSPYNTPALYSIMTYIDFGMGVFYPMGGIYKIIEALVKIGKKHGVQYRTCAAVEEIITENGKAKSIRLEGGEIIEADIVISNADIHHTETQLLKKVEDRSMKPRFWKNAVLAPSGFIMYLGLRDKVPSLTHHNLVFARNWKKNFQQIFDIPSWPDDPSFYVCAPSVTDASVAPEGKENLFVLVPIPAGLTYTDNELNAYADQILTTMEKEMKIPDLKKRILIKHLFCVKDFETRYNSLKGTALGLAHTLRQTAIFRPNTISKKVKNLYYVGGNTNPGIGMPICLISAELVYKRLIGNKTDGPLTKL